MWSPRTKQKRSDTKGRGGRGRRHDGPLVEFAAVEEILDAIERVDLKRPWPDIGESLLPVLPRRRAMPPGGDRLLWKRYPPGIEVGFGVDIGPAFMYVTETLLDGWGVTVSEVAARALGNLKGLAAARGMHALLCDSVDGVPTRAFQSREGWASALVLMPDEFARRFGEDPMLVLLPMRDVVFTMPIDTDRDLATWFLEELRSMDPNALEVPLLAWAAGRFRLDVGLAPPADA
ncbi:MAG: hypothetical protein H0W00_04215 [Chloroflexi bacterium]|nr:hypothetical protein [Chloroflexota bacterium]